MKEITINSRKFDGKIHRSWKANLIDETNEIFLFVGEFETEVRHPHLGVIRPGTISYEYYWKDDWFNVFRFHQPDGKFRNYYCNINKPPFFKDNTLDYVDLDIDILVWEDFSFQILDLDEFDENVRKFGYSENLQNKVQKILSTLLGLIKSKTFPFDTHLLNSETSK